jgi:hypothetical protein
MDFRFGHLCDYAGVGNAGKLILVGLFDSVFTATLDGPVAIPRSFLVFRLECGVAEGAQHAVAIRLIDEDGEEMMSLPSAEARFFISAPGRPLTANVIAELDIAVPHIGDYTFEIVVDGRRLGEVPFYVVPRPQPPAA